MGAVALLRLIAIALSGVLPCTALAHHPGGGAAASSYEPWAVAALAASGLLYAIGVTRLWRKAGVGRGIARAQALRFVIGWSTLALALLSPIDAWGEALFSVHMVQHELLMVVAAPLLVMGRPLEAWTWALPRAAPHGLFRIANARIFAAVWKVFTEPLGAWAVHAVVLWVWHVPALFQAALENEGIHVLQHASFLASALLFWGSVARRETPRDGVAVASLFTTMMHTGALGALLTFAPTPWYAHYAAVGGAFGLSALEDQQLGGLVMWVPAGMTYMVGALALVARWLSPVELHGSRGAR
jgi:putative membrane protein